MDDCRLTKARRSYDAFRLVEDEQQRVQRQTNTEL
jgi:hypothetical protein